MEMCLLSYRINQVSHFEEFNFNYWFHLWTSQCRRCVSVGCKHSSDFSTGLWTQVNAHVVCLVYHVWSDFGAVSCLVVLGIR